MEGEGGIGGEVFEADADLAGALGYGMLGRGEKGAGGVREEGLKTEGYVRVPMSLAMWP